MGSTSEAGLLALNGCVGLGVLTEPMGEEVDDLVRPKGKHNVDRIASAMGTRTAM